MKLVEQRRNCLKTSAASTKVLVYHLRSKRQVWSSTVDYTARKPHFPGLSVQLPASKIRFASHTMAQNAGIDTPLIVVYVTVPNKETATTLSTSLVSNKLAACVNQVPGVVSTYMWEGKLETDEGILLIVKTRQSLLDALTVHVKANHPYTVPEVIALPILGGSDSYVKWVADNTVDNIQA